MKKLMKATTFIPGYEDDLYQYANSISNFSRWVKIKLKEEMKNNQQLLSDITSSPI